MCQQESRCIVQEPEDTAPRLVSFMKVLCCAQNTIEHTECKVLRSKPPISPTEYDALRTLSLNCVILKKVPLDIVDIVHIVHYVREQLNNHRPCQRALDRDQHCLDLQCKM